MQILRNADLAPHTTFGVPAKAAALVTFQNAEELRACLQHPELKELPRLVIGGGSNLLFTRDWPGVVLLNAVPGIDVLEEDADSVLVRAGAGVMWHEFVLHCVTQGWGGLENLSLIPGRVGAAPMQNIGAYGVEIKDTFDHLLALRVADGEVVRFDRAACQFGYRESFFKRAGRDQYVILQVAFRLHKHPKLNTSYGNIRQELEKRGIAQPTLRDVSEAVIAIRSSKLPDPKVLGNAGSFFKNPVVPAAQAEQLRATVPDLVTYPAGDGLVKLAAGQLIEKAGWKGRRIGAAGMHKDQALVLVNHGGATGRELYDLSTAVLEDVKQRFGVELEREVNII